jgi:HSP20 family molecular chaperone IbpA
MTNNDFFEQLAGLKQEEDKAEAELMKATRTAVAHEDTETKLEPTISDALDELDDAEGHLTIDVYQTGNDIVIESAIAGISSDNLDIAITSESVQIKGKREKHERIKKSDYLYQECFWGKFSRLIILPQEVDPDRAQASLKNGILKIVLPKVEKSQGRKIKVKLD